MKTLSIIPPTVSTAVKPKPTKTEIVSALTQIRMAELLEKQRTARAKSESLREDVLQHAINVAKAGKLPKEATIHPSFWNKSIDLKIEIPLTCLPKEIQAKIGEQSRLSMDAHRIINEKAVRKEIQDRISNRVPTDERVNTLLKDKDSRDSLTKMLAALFTATPNR